jgi:phospholipase/carboxylesterase
MAESLENGALRRGLSFAYRVYRPQYAGDEALVLLHGSGVDETTLVPLAREIAPRATLIAVRGRIPQDGGLRWFTRITPTRFEQHSIRTETDAFASFIPALARQHPLDLRRSTFLGYSNGANLVSSIMLLHPGLIERAVLLRAMPVLDDVPAADLSKAQLLVIAGAADITYGPFAPALVALLRDHGANVEARTVASGHEFGAEDASIVREWLAPRTASSAR